MNPRSIRSVTVRARVDPIQEWAGAERERSLLPLAGVAQDEHAFHIDTCVPSVYAGDVRVDAFPTDILVEALRDGQIERFTRLHLTTPIDPAGVRASMRGPHLEIIAPKLSLFGGRSGTGRASRQ